MKLCMPTSHCFQVKLASLPQDHSDSDLSLPLHLGHIKPCAHFPFKGETVPKDKAIESDDSDAQACLSHQGLINSSK